MLVTQSSAVKPVTWGDLCTLEPRLRAIAAEAAQSDSEYAYVYLKTRLERLVGWYAPSTSDPILQTAHAYNIACRAIHDLVGATSRSRGGRS